jgi:hypothetical protein
MSTNTYCWCPDLIFQITDDVRGKMVCIGRVPNKMNARCRWSIGYHFPSHSATVLRLLETMKSMRPKEITNTQVEELARFCLCERHGHQLKDAKIELLNRLDYAIRHHDQVVHGRVRRYTEIFGVEEGEEDHQVGQLGVAAGNFSFGGGGDQDPRNPR